MSHPAINVDGLHKSFGSKQVLRGVDLAVAPGSVFALLGQNGAGKTTLINILTTLLQPDGGAAAVAGHDVVSAPEDVKKSISLTGQFAAVDEVLTGRENLIMVARLLGFSRTGAQRRADELLTRFDLQDAASQRVKTYSGGMRRRLDLAVSLTTAPPVIFLDEPTTGLDAHSRLALWNVITELAEAGITIFLTTQYLEEADALADQIAIIDGGIIIAQGTPDSLKSRIGGDVVEVRNQHHDLIREIPTDGSVDGLRAAIDQLDGTTPAGCHVSVRSPRLEDVFLALTGGTPPESLQEKGLVA